VVVAALVGTTSTATAVAGSSFPHAERAKSTTQPNTVDLRRMRHSASGSALQHRDRRLLTRADACGNSNAVVAGAGEGDARRQQTLR
jgi:hypothetical protein